MTAGKKNRISWPRRLINRTAKWARRRHAPDTIPYTISGRRIYIIPSRFGLVYALAVFALLLGSMNYSNSLAFFLTFMLTAAGFLAMHLTHANLSSISLEPALSEPVFATEPAILKLHLKSENLKLHPQITVRSKLANNFSTQTAIDKEGSIGSLVIDTFNRGYIELDHFSVSTRFPLNLFYAWTEVFQPLRCLVYPQPAETAPEIFGEQDQDESIKSSHRIGQDDFAGLRDYQWQDSPQHIAWKSYASHNKLLVKQYHEAVAKTVWFDIDALTDNDLETRLSQLCRLILDADKAKTKYGLSLGSINILPNLGEQHRHNCLRALALYQKPKGSEEQLHD